jgi:hypothetical protein
LPNEGSYKAPTLCGPSSSDALIKGITQHKLLVKKKIHMKLSKKSQGRSSTRLNVEDTYIQKQEIPPKNCDLQGKIIRAEFKHNFSKNIQYRTSNSKS